MTGVNKKYISGKKWLYALGLVLVLGVIALFSIGFSVTDLGDLSSADISGLGCEFVVGCGVDCVFNCAENMGSSCFDVANNYVDAGIFTHEGKDFVCVLDSRKSFMDVTSGISSVSGGGSSE